ncbi:MAG: DUF4286 family protein, partial [Woeseiaceae bacterium]
MTTMPGVIYEVSLAIEPEIADEFDAWLPVHIEEMLAQPGFIDARSFTLENDDSGRVRRVTHYHLESEGDLERYLDGPAGAMRQSVVERFGDKFVADRRILHATLPHGTRPSSVEHCLNCKATLAGQYCATCGQRARSRLISLWELVSDAFGDLFELDSRLWRTLIPLTFRPGLLTRDYLEGRRARYMPPFRMYLVLSIIFFVIAFFDPKSEFQILFEPDESSPSDIIDAPEDDAAEKSEKEIAREVVEELAAEGIVVDEEILQTLESESAGPSIRISDEGESGECEVEGFDSAELPQWLAKRLTRDRLLQICNKIKADNGKQFARAMLDKVPAALFFLLPLMALVLKVLYPLSKRYYVEHLLFVVHFHAFFFLVLSLQVLLDKLGRAVLIPSGFTTAAIVAVSFYIPVYLFKAMRRVYGQGGFLTFL